MTLIATCLWNRLGVFYGRALAGTSLIVYATKDSTRIPRTYHGPRDVGTHAVLMSEQHTFVMHKADYKYTGGDGFGHYHEE